jgi:ribokinase
MRVSRPLITVLGSLNMDLVALCDRAPRLGETVAGREFRTVCGGKGANQAIAAARAGGRVAMIGAVGQDGFGQELVANLERDGVDTTRVRRVAGASGTAHIVVDGQGQNAIVVVPGANGTLLELTAEDRALIRQSAYLVLQLEVPLPVVTMAAREARAAGVQVVLTPAPARPLPPELLSCVDWLVPNQHEAAALTGLAEIDAAAGALLGMVGNLVVTLGDEGCLYLAPGREPLRVPAPRVQAVDTTGAGDTFTGALVVALAEGKDAATALQWACRAAAISVTRLGASTSMPSRAEIDAFGT